MEDALDETHISQNILVFIAIIMTLMIISFIYAGSKIYKKYAGKITPNHVFQINLIISFALKLFYTIFMYIDTITKSWEEPSTCYHYITGLIIFMAVNLDILIVQIDRFIAIFWSLYYPGLATNGRALWVCLGVKTFTMLVAILAVAINPDYMECFKVYPLLLTNTTNMILISCPQLLVTVVVCIVSSYLGYKMVQIKKSVTPAVNIPTSNISELNQNQNLEMSTQQITQVRRIDDQPNMFYNVDVMTEEHREEVEDIRTKNTANLNKEESKTQIFQMAKTALNMNYVVIFHCLINTPLSIMTIIYWNCNNDIGKCNHFLVFNKIMIVPRLLTICTGFVIFYHKIRKGEN